MTADCGKLVFLTGPDSGAVVSLRMGSNPLVLGRSGSANIQIRDGYASREHLSLQNTADGMLLDVLSSNGIEVGLDKARKYKKGKALLIDSGDVIAIGTDTRILFVASGDSVDDWVAKVKPFLPEKAQKSARVVSGEVKSASPQMAQMPEAGSAGNASEQTNTAVTEKITVKNKSKSSKIMFILGVYFVFIAAVGIFIYSAKSGKAEKADNRPPVLSSQQIQQFITTTEPMRENRAESEQQLELACRYFASRHINTGDAYMAVHSYVLHKALNSSGRFAAAVDQDNFKIVCDELMGKIIPLYSRAVAASRQQRYASAIDDFEQLLGIVPLQTDPFNANCQKHLAWNRKKFSQSKKRRSRSPFDR